MDRQVEEMIAKYMKMIEMIIKCEGKESDETARIRSPNVQQILNISYSKIIYYRRFIIAAKRTMKSIGIDKNA